MVFGVDGLLIGCRVMIVVDRIRIMSRRRMLLRRRCVIVIGS